MSNYLTLELLVCGYIKEIQTLLNTTKESNTNQIIPESIFVLCHQFSLLIFRILFFKNTATYSTDNSFHIFKETDFKTNTTFELKPNKFKNGSKTYMSHSPFCYIPNISSLFSKSFKLELDLKTSCDGIFACHGYSNHGKNYLKPCFSLFNSQFAETSTSDDINIIHEFESNTLLQHKGHGLLGLNNVIYCGEKYGIIYEDTNKFYGLRLQNIKSAQDFKFKVLCKINIEKRGIRSSVKYLSLCYCDGIQKVFTAQCEFIEEDRPFPQRKFIRNIECGLLDLKDKKWNNVKPYKYNKKYDSSRDNNNICYDDIYGNRVFMNTGANDTVKYDFHKNEWKCLCSDTQIYTDITSMTNVFWVDKNNGNILNLLYCNAYGGDVNFNTFDLRDKTKKWIQQNSFKYGQEYRVKLFC
eukprot:264544_1